MRNARVMLAVVASGWAQGGCATELSHQLVEGAYAEARAPRAVCRAGDVTCCTQQVAAARVAGGKGQSARAAHLWHGLAMACPERRGEATAAARSLDGAAGSTAEILNVSYRVRLPPVIRLYWVSTAVSGRLLPLTGASPGAQTLEVEIQAIRFTGSRPGPLLAVNRRLDLVLPRAPRITLEIAEAPPGAPAPLEVTAHVEEVQPPRERSAAPPSKPRPAPRLEPARVVRLAPPRAPLEFGPLAGVKGAGLWACLDREGQVESIRFQDVQHPRLAASLVDMLRDARHEPYRVNDLAVPSCRSF